MQQLNRVAIVLFVGMVFPLLVHADICKKGRDLETTQDTKKQVDFYEKEMFKQTAFHGNRTWNEIVLECNRKRDNKGNEVTHALVGSDSKSQKDILLRKNLRKKVIRGNYNFFGTEVTGLKYRYLLSKTNGVWTMVIPYNPILNEVVENRVDFYMGYREETAPSVMNKSDSNSKLYAAWTMFEADQVHVPSMSLKMDARPIAETRCTSSTFFPGQEHKYDGQNNEYSYKRDKENRHISIGKIQYVYNETITKHADYWHEGCRVRKSMDLYWQEDPSSTSVVKVKPQDWILDNFVRVAEAYWSTPDNFDLKILLKGVNEDRFSKDTLDMLQDGDYLTIRFANKFLPYKFNQMYKSNMIQFNNFSTMTTDGTYLHEVGHAFGLDDEYGKDEKEKACENTQYNKLGTDTYQMCDAGAEEVRTIYHFIAVSRYVTTQKECQEDTDCKSGEWCDAGVDTKINQCRTLLDDGDSCPLVNGGHACKSGSCKFSKCYTPNSVAMGGSCFVNDQCKQGKCNNAVDGTPGTCVCDADGQCGSGQYCDKGLDLTQNRCIPLKSDNESCALADGGRTCISNHCKFGRCYTPASVAMGGTCYVNEACKQGKCSSVNGTRGTCVCDRDQDCDAGYWCDKGVDLTVNRCIRKLNQGEVCGKVGELGAGHRCKSGKCKAAGLVNLVCQ